MGSSRMDFRRSHPSQALARRLSSRQRSPRRRRAISCRSQGACLARSSRHHNQALAQARSRAMGLRRSLLAHNFHHRSQAMGRLQALAARHRAAFHRRSRDTLGHRFHRRSRDTLAGQ
jgi:hypothetical protein